MSEKSEKKGVKVRKEVMGEKFVQRAVDNTTQLTAPLQDWINEHAWGSTWQRDGLSHGRSSSNDSICKGKYFLFQYTKDYLFWDTLN